MSRGRERTDDEGKRWIRKGKSLSFPLQFVLRFTFQSVNTEKKKKIGKCWLNKGKTHDTVV